jgi:hypothetical protein
MALLINVEVIFEAPLFEVELRIVMYRKAALSLQDNQILRGHQVAEF